MALKSREGILPPANFYAQVLGHLIKAYPDAQITANSMASLKPAWDQLWQSGRPADVVAKTTCSCDGKHITLSPVYEVELPRGAYRGPKGAERGALFDPQQMRESAPVERTAKSLDRVVGDIAKVRAKADRFQARADKSTKPEQKQALMAKIQDQVQAIVERQKEADEIGRNLETLRKKLGTMMLAKPASVPVAKKPPARAAKPAKPPTTPKPAVPKSASPKPAAPKAPPKAPAPATPLPAASSEPAAVDSAKDAKIMEGIRALLPSLAQQMVADIRKGKEG